MVVRVMCEYREGKKDGDLFLRDCNGHPIIQKFDLTVDRLQSASLLWATSIFPVSKTPLADQPLI